MSQSDAATPDMALAQALLRLPPDEIETAVRPISPELADLLMAHTQERAREMAERTVAETIKAVNRERTRLLIKDQLRMLLLVEDRDFATLAAAEMLSREPTSQRAVHYANGGIADIGHDATGAVYARLDSIARSCGYGLPATGVA
jgi:hypothetical protein